MISKEQVEHIAKLARIDLTEQEREKMAQELGSILDYVAQLERVDTSSVEPTAQITDLENVFRPDDAVQPIDTISEVLMENIPAREGRHLKVKSVFTGNK